MIYQKDWLMRQIEAMVSFLIHIIFHRTEEHAGTEPEQTTQEEIANQAKLHDLLRAGQLCTAEDWLYENMDEADLMWFRLAVYFYEEANQCTDSFLEAHNFPREEILSGLAEICRVYGMEDLLKLGL